MWWWLCYHVVWGCLLSIRLFWIHSNQNLSQGRIPRYPYILGNCLGIPKSDWSVRSDCTMCIWNKHDETEILFLLYIIVTHMALSFYLLFPVIYCLAIAYSNRIGYVFAIKTFLLYHRFEFSISDFYFNEFLWHEN